MKNKIKVKNDSFRKKRGGYTRFFLITCGKCSHPVCFYQKDGKGLLKRLYFDRIIAPVSLVTGKKQQLICKKCKALLAVSTIYREEKRRCYQLFAWVVYKKIVKADSLPPVTF